MNKLPIIGIVSRFDKDKMNSSLTKNNEIGEYYVKVINKYNGIPVGILPVQDVLYTDLRYDEVPKLTEPGKEKIIKVLELCDGVLLPGGNRWFEYEEFICQYAHDNNIPLLGICQGMQVMGYLSRKVSDQEDEDLKTYRNNTCINHQALGVKYVHKVRIQKDSKIFNILKNDDILVNSRHNYNIGRITNLKISAVSEDGIIEGIEDSNKTFYVGVQWHPELMDEYDLIEGNIIKEFIKSCK